MKKNNLKLRVYIFLISVFIFSGIFLFVINQLESLLRDIIFKSLIGLSIFYILFPFLKINSNWLVSYFFCFDRDWWDKRVQRPRIFIYLIYFLFLYLIISIDNSEVNYIIHFTNNFILIFYLMIGVVLLGRIVWDKKFESALLPEIKLLLRNDVNLRKLDSKEIEELITRNKTNIDESSIDDFRLFLEGKKPINKIKWIGTSGKRVVTYTDLFFLIHSIMEDSGYKFERSRRREFLNLIINNFEKFENLESKEITYNNLNSAYTNFVL